MNSDARNSREARVRAMTQLTDRRRAPKSSLVRPTVGQPQKVLFIMGMTRSGSTMLAKLLGELPGFFAAGELRALWKRLVARRECGCGELIGECDVWARVLEDTLGEDAGDRRIDPREVISWQHRNVRIKHTWRLVGRRSAAVRGAQPADYRSLIAPLYRSLAAHTGARVIVDSSKRPSDAALLRLIPELDVYFVHLVRDPRAVAYSWRRVKPTADRGGPDQMAQHGPIHSTLRWALRDIGSRAVVRRVGHDRVLVLRYESFVARPRAAVESILHLVDEEGGELPFLDETTVLLGRNHVLSGNPSRFVTGPVRLLEDSEWRSRQTLLDRATSTALALPLLRAYGYGALPGRRHGS